MQAGYIARRVFFVMIVLFFVSMIFSCGSKGGNLRGRKEAGIEEREDCMEVEPCMEGSGSMW